MSKIVFCSACARTLCVEDGGWPFVYAQFVRHLNGCLEAPTSERVHELATRLASAFLGAESPRTV